MATTDLIGAQERAENAATEPLPQSAVVTRYEVATAHLDELAGRPAETASRYRQADQHCRQLAEAADFDAWANTQDEMTMCRRSMQRAGRLDLVGGA